MSILSWTLAGLLIGLLAGFVADGYGLPEDLIVGVVGAVIGGWLAILLIGAPVADLHPASLVAALGGAAAFLAASRGLTRGRREI